MSSGPSPRAAAGREAEDMAERFLRQRGLRLLARNYRVKGGEIDLVCRDGRTTVFVEVRLRRGQAFGGAAASITASKRTRLILAARHWLVEHGNGACRFDCVLLPDLDESRLEWLQDAFSAD
ncbi:MAG TPA: YraN family protein [Azospira sp.]|nr:YraN family protein [Azospira sp.]